MWPLRELAVRAERVSDACWEFDAPVEVLQTRELEPIAISIQKLLNGLRKSFERQRQFTGDAAHELKTSIAVLKSSVQLLSMKERTPREYQSRLEGLLVDTQRMEDLTNRMLLLARAEQAPSGAMKVMDLVGTLRVVVERLQPAMQLRQVHIHWPEQGPRMVRIEPEGADILCSNLLMNAVQHSAPESAIRVGVQARGKSVELTISDEGDGIPPEALPHIFERFYRADSSRSRVNGGAGLGLAICKAIVDRCGGSISIVSTVGVGTKVNVVLLSA
jgi:signal transduction histidine kinase